jgi:hypothetical protein
MNFCSLSIYSLECFNFKSRNKVLTKKLVNGVVLSQKAHWAARKLVYKMRACGTQAGAINGTPNVPKIELSNANEYMRTCSFFWCCKINP